MSVSPGLPLASRHTARSQVDSEFEDQDRLIVASVQRVGGQMEYIGWAKEPAVLRQCPPT
jgi:hypothetical protein